MKLNRLLSLLFLVLLATPAFSQQAFLTFLNNSSDAAQSEVDVYVTQSGNTSKVENLQFQKADNFNSAIVFGGFECYIDVAPKNSMSKDEAIATLTFTPNADAGYEIELRGNVGDGFVANPDGVATNLKISYKLVPYVDPTIGESSVIVSHGSTDLEACDVYVRGTSTPLFTNIKYGDFSPSMKKLKRQRQTIDLTKVGDKSKILASFEIDLSLISSDVIVLTISGYKTPADNKQSTNELALLAVLEDGNVVRYPLLSGSQTARVQFIHNSADPQLATVDVYLNGTKAIDNLSFKRATAFADYAAGTDVVIGIAPATSTGIKDTFLTVSAEQFRPGRAYHLILNGMLDTAKFSPNSASGNIYLTVLEKDGALEKGTTANETSVRSVHGVIDLGAIDLVVGGTSLGGNMTFNSVSPEYINITGNQTDTVWAVNSTTGSKIRGWVADLRGSERAVVLALSGVVGPDSNQKAEAYELILIEPNGTVNDRLAPVDSVASVANSELVPSALWTLAPNPATTTVSLTIPIADVTGEIGQGAWARVVDLAGNRYGENVGMQVGNGEVHGSIDLVGLPSGTYRIYVTTAGGRFVGSTQLQVVR